MTSVSSDPSVATTEKQGSDRGSDFNQIVYGCTLCIHEQNTALGGAYFLNSFQGVNKASLLILKEQQSRILHVKDLSPLVFQLHRLPHPQLKQVKHLSGFIRNTNNH